MGKYELVLRFRNVVSGSSDNVNAHEAVLADKGSVWWGWWKKSNEPDGIPALRALKCPVVVALVSAVEGVGYEAVVSEIRFDPPADTELIPEHYRHMASTIPAWFRVRQFTRMRREEVEPIAAVVGGRSETLFTRAFSFAPIDGVQTVDMSEHESVVLLHLSDLHLGGDHAFVQPGAVTRSVPEAAEAPVVRLAELIGRDVAARSLQPAVVLITGDHVTKCEWDGTHAEAFIGELSQVLGLGRDRIVSVPGNHDFFRGNEKVESFAATSYQHENHFLSFRNRVWGTNTNEPIERVVRIVLRGGAQVVVGTLNSARWNTVERFQEYGFVGRDRLQSLLGRMQRVPNAIRVLALHHHLLPVASQEAVPGKSTRPVSLTLDAGVVLEEACQAGVSLVLHGHQHSPAVARFSRVRGSSAADRGIGDLDTDLCVLAGGSAGSRELPSSVPNTYGALTLSPTSGLYEVYGLDSRNAHARRTLLSVPVPVRSA